MFCARCGNPLDQNASFCGQCGEQISRAPQPPAPAVFVSPPPAQPLHTQPPPATVYVQVQSPPAPGLSNKSRLAYILLGLFLGGLGIHNFYAGFVGRGIAQLLITLFLWWLVVPLIIVGIWCLIEVITVTRDAQGLAFS